MRRFAIVLVAALSLAACSSTIPRFPAVYAPPTPANLADPGTDTATDPTAAPTAAPTLAPAADSSAWTKLAPAGKPFTALTPGPAKEDKQTIKTDAGNATVTGWTYTDGTKRAFTVTLVDFPKGALANTASKVILDGAATSVLSTLAGSSIISQSDTTLGKYPGRQISFGNAATSAICIFYIVGADQVVGVSVSSPAGTADDGFTAAFFASLQITA